MPIKTEECKRVSDTDIVEPAERPTGLTTAGRAVVGEVTMAGFCGAVVVSSKWKSGGVEDSLAGTWWTTVPATGVLTVMEGIWVDRRMLPSTPLPEPSMASSGSLSSVSSGSSVGPSPLPLPSTSIWTPLDSGSSMSSSSETEE